MQFEQHYPDDLWTPSSDDGGVQQLYTNLSSLDFYLIDDIDVHLPSVETKTSKTELINDSLTDDSPHHEDIFSDFDLGDFNDFEEKADFIRDLIGAEDIDIAELISQSSFPTSLTDVSESPASSTEDGLSVLTPATDELISSTDMIVPPSPTLLSTVSTSISSKKRSKLSPNERKIRKKSQNKTAAEKYRQRKKSERHELTDRHSQLKDKNAELKSELENLTYRVHQFKKLFSEILHVELPMSN